MQAMPLCWMKKGPLKTPLAYEYQAKMHVRTVANLLSINFFFVCDEFCRQKKRDFHFFNLAAIACRRPLSLLRQVISNVIPDRAAHPTEWRTSQCMLERTPNLNPKNVFLYKKLIPLATRTLISSMSYNMAITALWWCLYRVIFCFRCRLNSYSRSGFFSLISAF